VAAGRTGTLVLRLSAKMLKAGRALRGLDRPVEMLVVVAASDRAGNARRAFKTVLMTRLGPSQGELDRPRVTEALG
jgi:hypothetical protein